MDLGKPFKPHYDQEEKEPLKGPDYRMYGFD
jgi:hypothetical protein